MSETWIDRFLKQRGALSLTLLCIVLVGACFRLSDLGLAAFRADEGFFWRICNQPISAAQVWQKWIELQGISGQFPFSAAFTKWFVSFFNLPVNHFTVRLPSALWGILTMLGAYGAGRMFAGRGFGLTLALLLAINPFHIQLSREAYFYPPLVCGAFLEVWVALWMFDHLRNGKPITPLLYGINAVGFFLLTYSQPSGWPLALCVVLTMVFGVTRQVINTRRLSPPYVILLGTFLIIGLPLLVTDWGLKQHMQAVSPERKEQILRIFGHQPFLPGLWKILTVYGWGSTTTRSLFTTATVVLGLAFFARRMKTDKRGLLILLFLLVGIAFAISAIWREGGSLNSRYLAALLPLYLVVMVSGIISSAELAGFGAGKNAGGQGVLPALLLGIATVLWLQPAYFCTQLTGKPTPYKQINSWVDANLPHGTLVLVDRWFEPWCELRDEPSTNVVYTYTLPNEPVDVYTNLHWRESAMRFFARWPDAAYLEISKSYWTDPSIGPWEWPRQSFAHHVVFTNEAGLKLRALGLADREDFYASNTNRVVVELFYNSRADVLAKAKAAGQSFVVLYGPGWSYWKNGPGWPQAQQADYRDWRVMQDRAQIDLYNLTDQHRDCFVTVVGTSVGSGKQIKIENQNGIRFEGNKLEQCRIGPVHLPPGHSVLTLTDDLWSLAKVPLLVDRIELAAPSPVSKE